MRARTLAIALVALLALALAGGSALAASSPKAIAASGASPVTVRIFADYSLDHVINGGWTASELQAAVAAAKRQGAGFEEFQAAVQDVYDREFLGLHTGDGDGQTAQPAPASSSGLLPEPAGPGDHSAPPWPFIALTVLAGLLAVSGVGSSIYRRVHR